MGKRTLVMHFQAGHIWYIVPVGFFPNPLQNLFKLTEIDLVWPQSLIQTYAKTLQNAYQVAV